MPKVKNIIIFVSLAVALFAGYFFFLKPSNEKQATLTSSTPNPLPSAGSIPDAAVSQGVEAGNFLSLLLNVQTIKLNGAIFSSPAFRNLRDSSIELGLDGTEGRPNPFAQLGLEAPAPAPAPDSVPDQGVDEDENALPEDPSL